jgi:hypothetical protein
MQHHIYVIINSRTFSLLRERSRLLFCLYWSAIPVVYDCLQIVEYVCRMLAIVLLIIKV